MNRPDIDCVIVGYNDVDLAPIMAARERVRDVSGAYRQMLGSVFRYRGQWVHHAGLLNALLADATGRSYDLNTMKLPNLAVCYLSSFLARRGFRAVMVNFFNSEKARFEELLAASPRAVVITTSFYVESEPVREIVEFVRGRAPSTCIIVGGPHILNISGVRSPAAQDHLLGEMGADVYISDSQGEATLADVLARLREGLPPRLSDVPNLAFRSMGGDDGRIPREGGAESPPSAVRTGYTRTSRRAEDNPMDDDAPDWSLFPSTLYTPTAQMRISRSCPYACSFCRYPSLAGPVSLVSVDVIEREMRQFRDAGVGTLILVDDTPNVPIPRFKEILRMMIRNRFDFGWFSNLRCANTDDEVYGLLRDSGCRGVFLGIESGDQTILDNMNKRATLEKYRHGIGQLNCKGILTYASFIVGFPGETEETCRNTVRFIEETKPRYYQAHLYYHSKNVPIHAEAERFGLHGADYSWRHGTMGWEQACDLIDGMRHQITGSTLCSSYVSSFWWVAYLAGLGVALDSIQGFLQASSALLVRNSPDGAAASERMAEEIRPELLASAARIGRDLESAGAARTG